MHCAVLIIGSLLWDSKTTGRAEWRASRLDVGSLVRVRVPIYYGRKSGRSRGNSYTMTFRTGEPFGIAVLVPCVNEVKAIGDLVQETEALWKAEAPNSKTGTISSDWGCVGALFRSDAAPKELAVDWTAHFQKAKAQCVSVVNKNGLLDIGWPNTPNGQSADFDVILATANKPKDHVPTARVVADAWVDQCGYEDYFFNNVLHGIRTPDDGDIWRRIEERSPCWLGKKRREYQEAIKVLRLEVANHAQG